MADVPSASEVPLLDPVLLRRLLRAKDRMDAASHQAWPVSRLAEAVSYTHLTLPTNREV